MQRLQLRCSRHMHLSVILYRELLKSIGVIIFGKKQQGKSRYFSSFFIINDL